MRTLNLFATTLILGVMLSCQFQNKRKQAQQISVSILPQKYFVERIAGKDFNINVLIPPGGSPATYEPTALQMQQLAKSQAYFKIGHIPFEQTWINKMLKIAGNIEVYDLSENIELIKGAEIQHGDHFHEGGIDPHVWSSPKTAVQIAKNLYEALIALAPKKEKKYKQNLDQFLLELEHLNKETEASFSKLTKKSFMIFHPALSYLSRDYGLNQIPIEIHGKEPSPAHLKKLIEEAKKHDVKIVFIQKQFDKENAKLLAKEINAELIQINPLNENWLSEMKSIIGHLKKQN